MVFEAPWCTPNQLHLLDITFVTSPARHNFHLIIKFLASEDLGASTDIQIFTYEQICEHQLIPLLHMLPCPSQAAETAPLSDRHGEDGQRLCPRSVCVPTSVQLVLGCGPWMFPLVVAGAFIAGGVLEACRLGLLPTYDLQ